MRFKRKYTSSIESHLHVSSFWIVFCCVPKTSIKRMPNIITSKHHHHHQQFKKTRKKKIFHTILYPTPERTIFLFWVEKRAKHLTKKKMCIFHNERLLWVTVLCLFILWNQISFICLSLCCRSLAKTQKKNYFLCAAHTAVSKLNSAKEETTIISFA